MPSCCCSTTTAPWSRSRPRPSSPGRTARSSSCSGRWPTRPDTEVHLVSGRPQNVLQEWVGDLPIWLHAEHGFLSRDPATRQWVPAAELGGKLARARAGDAARDHPADPRLAGGGQGGGAGVALPHGGPGDRGAARQRAAPPPEPGPQQPARGDPRREPSDRDPALRRAQGTDRARRSAPSGRPPPPSSPSATTAPTRTSSPRSRRRRSPSGSGPAPRARGSGWTASPACATCCARCSRPASPPCRSGGESGGAPPPRDHRRARRPRARPGDRRGQSADLPHHHLRPRRRGQPSARLHLRPERQPDPPRARARPRRARRRRDRDRLRLGHGRHRGGLPVDASGRARRRSAGCVLRHGQAAPRGDGRLGSREHVRGHDGSARGRRGGSARDPAHLDRDPVQPDARGHRHRPRRRDRPRGRRALRVRQHLGHARAPAPARARLRPGDALDHQVPRRPQRPDRRRARLAGGRRMGRATPHPAGAGRGGAVGLRLLAAHARDPEPALADARALRERGRGGGVSVGATARSRPCTIPASRSIPGTRSPRAR